MYSKPFVPETWLVAHSKTWDNTIDPKPTAHCYCCGCVQTQQERYQQSGGRHFINRQPSADSFCGNTRTLKTLAVNLIDRLNISAHNMRCTTVVLYVSIPIFCQIKLLHLTKAECVLYLLRTIVFPCEVATPN